MNIIKPRFEIIEQEYNDVIPDMMHHIELCGRTCYKSNDKITEDSYKKFVGNLEKSHHGAMLEHGTIYLTIPVGDPLTDDKYMTKKDIINFFKSNPYSKVNHNKVYEKIDDVMVSLNYYYITTNYRVIYESKDKDIYIIQTIYNNYHIDLDNLDASIKKYITPPTEHHEKRYTVKFTCDIGVSREYNRHRKDSIAEESTRYCNYLKDKFSEDGDYAFGDLNGLNICKPEWITDIDKVYSESLSGYCKAIYSQKDDKFSDIDYWLFANLAAEYSYMNLIRLGWKPQQARTVLLLDTKTELIHTAFESDWKHFFDLRAIGTTGAPHPSAKELAEPLMKEFMNRGYIKL